MSFVRAVLAILVRRFDSNAAARQGLAKKYLDFGVDASQVRNGATLDSLENGFIRPERKRDAFRSGRPTSLSHDWSRIQGAGIDHGCDLPVANQDDKQIGDHGSLAFRVERVSELFLVKLVESGLYDAHLAFNHHAAGGNDRTGRLLAKHSARDLRRIGEV